MISIAMRWAEDFRKAYIGESVGLSILSNIVYNLVAVA